MLRLRRNGRAPIDAEVGAMATARTARCLRGRDATRARGTMSVCRSRSRPRRPARPRRGDVEHAQLVAGVHAPRSDRRAVLRQRRDAVPDYVLVAQDDTGEVVACAYSVPFVLEGGALPDNGWDFVIRNGLLASLRGQQPDAIRRSRSPSARPPRRGRLLRDARRCVTTPRGGASPSSSRRCVPTERPTCTSRCDIRVPGA